MGGIIWIIVVGFVAGIIARLLSPGPNNPSGFILTTVLGIAGAFLATFIGQAIGHYGPDQGAGFITATIGALVVLFIWNRLVARGMISDPGTGDGVARSHNVVMPGLVPRHPRLCRCTRCQAWMRRVKPGHDGDNRRLTAPDASPHPCGRTRRSCCSTPARPGSTPVARYRRPLRRPSAAPSPPRHRAPPWRRPRRGPW